MAVLQRVGLARCLLAGVLGGLFLATAAQAAPQYTFVDLGTGPAGYTRATLSGGAGGQFVGFGRGPATGEQTRALLWQAVDQQPIDITPADFRNFYARGIHGGQVVGEAYDGYQNHALLWPGLGESVIDLHPAGAYTSSAADIYGTQQAGWASGTATGETHAMLWSGSADRVVDLNPEGSGYSVAFAIWGGQQGGSISGPRTGEANHAALWSETAESVVDLNADWMAQSFVYGMDGNQQVGDGSLVGSLGTHAILWSGTPDSAVDLNPVGFASTRARGVRFGMQVGKGIGSATGNQGHALLWLGGPDAFLDLHTLLPSEYMTSEAYSIDDFGNILGSASIDGVHSHAIMWTPVPEPCTVFLVFVASIGWRRYRRKGA